MNGTEHLEWAKKRAIAELEFSGISSAIASIQSDLRKHPETENHTGLDLMTRLVSTGHLTTKEDVRKFIEGFN